MRIDDNIRTDTLTGEWHVLCKEQNYTVVYEKYIHVHSEMKTLTNLLPIYYSTRSFLSMSTGKLVTNLRNSNRANTNFAELVALLID